MDTRTFTDAIGKKELIRAVGTTPQGLQHYLDKGLFTPQWYKPIKLLAEAKGVPFHDDLFAWKDFPIFKEERAGA